MQNPYQQQMMPWNMGFQNPYSSQQGQDLMLLQQLSQGYAPVMTMPQQQMRTGFENLPGFNSPGLMGFAMNAFVAPMMQQQMSRHGMIPGGLSSQNMLDYMHNQQFQNQQQEMLRRVAGDTTQAGVVDFFRGAAEMTGREFGAPQRTAARQIGSMAATFAPILAQMFPEQLDAISGRKGSAVVMAHKMSNTNRFRVDPVTGLMGYDPESSEQQFRTLFDEMYDDENMANMRGVRAGEVGGMYQELSRRGMIGRDPRSTSLRTAEAAENVWATGGDAAQSRMLEILGADAPRAPGGGIDFNKLNADQMTKLRNQTDVSTQLRSFDSEKIKSSLEGYVDVVSTMKEIFGEAGQPNAPMAKLIASLETLSQGALTQMNPGRLNEMIRTTTQLAQTSGMSIDSALMIQQHAAGALQNRGMNPVMAMQLTQGGLAFGQAMGAQGAFANPAWGLGNMDQNRQLDVNLRANAAASPLVNAMAAVTRGGTAVGGYEAGTLDPITNKRTGQSEAFALDEALRDGRSFYKHPESGERVHIGNMTPQQMGLIMASGSDAMSQTQAGSFLSQRAANQEDISRFGFANLGRTMQPAQISRNLYQKTANYTVRSYLTEKGLDVGMAGGIGEAVSDAMQGMTAEERTDRTTRTQIMADAIHEASGGLISDQDAKVQAELMWGTMEQKVSRDPRYQGFESMQNLMLQMDPSTQALSVRQRNMGAFSAKTKNALSGLTAGGSWMGKLMGAVQEAGQGEEGSAITDVLGKAFGSVRAETVRDMLKDPLIALNNQRAKVKNLEMEYANAAPDDMGRIGKELGEELIVLENQSNKLRTMAEVNGLLDQQGALDLTDIQEQEDAQQTVVENREEFQATQVGDGASLRRAEKELRAKNRELLEGAVLDPNFIKKSGGRGLRAIQNMEVAMRTQTRLSSYFGGDAALQSVGLVDRVGQKDRLINLAQQERELLFNAEGDLNVRFKDSPELWGKSEDEIMGNTGLKVILGAEHVRIQQMDANRAIEDSKNLMKDVLTAGGREFILTPSGDVLDALRISGDADLTPDDMRNARRLQGYRNVSMGIDETKNLSAEAVQFIANEKWEDESTEEGRKANEDTAKRLAVQHGLPETSWSAIKKVARLGERVGVVGRLGEKGDKTIATINRLKRLANFEAGKQGEGSGVGGKRHNDLLTQIDTEKRNLENQHEGAETADQILAAHAEVSEEEKRLSGEAHKIARLDPRDRVGGLGAALGLDEAGVDRLRKDFGSYGQTDTGGEIIQDITVAAKLSGDIIGGAGLNSKKTYGLIEEAKENNWSADRLADELNKGGGETVSVGQAQELLRHGGVLKKSGMLGGLALGYEGDRLTEHVSGELASLQDTRMSSEDLKERILTIRGTVTLKGSQLLLDQLEGTEERP